MTPRRTTKSAQREGSGDGVAQNTRIDHRICATSITLVGGRALFVVGETADQRLAAVADAQNAQISSPQLAAIGFTIAMIRTRVEAGRLRRRHQGVYAVGHALDVALGNETAALLAVGPPVAAAFGSAAFLWGLLLSPPPEAEVVVAAPRSSRSRRGIRIHRSTTLTAKDVQLHHGLPITTPTRTLLDLAATRPQRELERALDEALHRRLTSPTKIRDAIARTPTHPGTRPLTALLDPDRARGTTRSELEQRMLAIIRAAALPDPERNARIGPYEVDLLWPAASLVIEVDSYQWHSGPRAFKRDRRKDAYLKDHGLDVLRVTSEMIDEPLPLVARIARIIAERTRRTA
jgi:very-short-patch-repair endonuclease